MAQIVKYIRFNIMSANVNEIKKFIIYVITYNNVRKIKNKI